MILQVRRVSLSVRSLSRAASFSQITGRFAQIHTDSVLIPRGDENKLEDMVQLLKYVPANSHEAHLLCSRIIKRLSSDGLRDLKALYTNWPRFVDEKLVSSLATVSHNNATINVYLHSLVVAGDYESAVALVLDNQRTYVFDRFPLDLLMYHLSASDRFDLVGQVLKSMHASGTPVNGRLLTHLFRQAVARKKIRLAYWMVQNQGRLFAISLDTAAELAHMCAATGDTPLLKLLWNNLGLKERLDDEYAKYAALFKRCEFESLARRRGFQFASLNLSLLKDLQVTCFDLPQLTESIPPGMELEKVSQYLADVPRRDPNLLQPLTNCFLATFVKHKRYDGMLYLVRAISKWKGLDGFNDDSLALVSKAATSTSDEKLLELLGECIYHIWAHHKGVSYRTKLLVVRALIHSSQISRCFEVLNTFDAHETLPLRLYRTLETVCLDSGRPEYETYKSLCVY